MGKLETLNSEEGNNTSRQLEIWENVMPNKCVLCSCPRKSKLGEGYSFTLNILCNMCIQRWFDMFLSGTGCWQSACVIYSLNPFYPILDNRKQHSPALAHMFHYWAVTSRVQSWALSINRCQCVSCHPYFKTSHISCTWRGQFVIVRDKSIKPVQTKLLHCVWLFLCLRFSLLSWSQSLQFCGCSSHWDVKASDCRFSPLWGRWEVKGARKICEKFLPTVLTQHTPDTVFTEQWYRRSIN